MDTPLISVLMGVYYQQADIYLLKRSVTSILNQTEKDFELLICDDGSTPEACAYLESLASNDRRIQLIRSGDRFHLAKKLNACIKKSRGKYLARMDDDDFSFPDRFSKQIATLSNDDEIAFVGSNVALYRNGYLAGTRIFPEKPTVQDFLFVQPYIHPTLIFRREVLLSVNGYNETPSCVLCEDYDLLLRLYAKGYQGKNLQEDLLIYTLPNTVKGSRKMSHRWNETVTRYHRFKELGVLPKAFPYVVKPLVVGLVPEGVLKRIKGFKQ